MNKLSILCPLSHKRITFFPHQSLSPFHGRYKTITSSGNTNNICLLLFISIWRTNNIYLTQTKHYYMRPFTKISSVIFGVISLIHIYRIFSHFQLSAFNTELPVWVNAVGFVIAGILCIGLWKESKK